MQSWVPIGSCLLTTESDPWYYLPRLAVVIQGLIRLRSLTSPFIWDFLYARPVLYPRAMALPLSDHWSTFSYLSFLKLSTTHTPCSLKKVREQQCKYSQLFMFWSSGFSILLLKLLCALTNNGMPSTTGFWQVCSSLPLHGDYSPLLDNRGAQPTDSCMAPYLCQPGSSSSTWFPCHWGGTWPEEQLPGLILHWLQAWSSTQSKQSSQPSLYPRIVPW